MRAPTRGPWPSARGPSSPARRRIRDDAGAVGLFVAFLGMALFLLAGLVIDSSRQLNARARAVAIAEEAARAGAEAANPQDRDITLDPDQATRRVAAYCARMRAVEANLVTCAVSRIDGADVTVQTQISLPGGLLGIIKPRLDASGTGTAHSEIGTTPQDAQ